jgi:hypothetical protein
VVLLASAGGTLAAGGLAAVAWVAFKVGALSYGGGFVIIPLMQRDAVHTYHWMSAGQFLTAVALGQVTPGPVVQTVAVVGYAAAGIGGGLLASAVAFAPSFVFVLGGGRYFDRLRGNARVQAFLTGAGPAAIGAIGGGRPPGPVPDPALAGSRTGAGRDLAHRPPPWRGDRHRRLRRLGRDRLPGRRPGDVTTDGGLHITACVMIMPGSSGFPQQKSATRRRCGRAVEA